GSIDRARACARAAWNQALGKIAVKGGTEDERTIFYTALYRTLSRGTDITEEGRYYSGYDNKIHFTEGRHFYTADAFWDTYRSLHPVQFAPGPARTDGSGVVVSADVRAERMDAQYSLLARRAAWQGGSIAHPSALLVHPH